MKIAQIIPNLSSGGAEKFVVDLSNELSITNEVTLLTLYPSSKDDFFRKDIKRTVQQFHFKKRKGGDFFLFFEILKWLKKNQIDIVHVHIGAIPYVLFAAIFLKNHMSFFATIHSDAKFECRSLIGRILRKLLFCLKLVYPITISKESQDSFYKLYKVKSSLILNGTNSPIFDDEVDDIEKYRFTEKTKIFVNVARIMPVKNQGNLVKSFNKLLIENTQDIVLLLIGRIEDREYFKLHVEPFLNSRIVHLGELNNPRKLLRYADFFCLPSLVEGLPITLIESFSVGVIPIVSNVGGCRNIVQDSVNGFFINGTSIQDIFDCLVKILKLPSKTLNTIRTNCLNSFNEFSITNTASKYISLFNNQDKNESTNIR